MSQSAAARWSNPGVERAGPGFRPRVVKAVAALTGLATCVGLITYAVLWLAPPKAPRLMVITAGYADTLLVSANPTGTPVERLSELGRSGGRGRIRADPLPHRLTRGDALRILDELARARTPAVVAVFAAHGGCDPDGPFLMPDDATPEPEHRVRVKAVLDAVAKLPAATRKLLVFDATATPASPSLGQFHNDFARGVLALDADIAAVPNLVVFIAGGVNQQSWRSPELGGSVFLHHLSAGLAGGGDANRDGRLTAAELTEFVTRKTRDWARDHRAALQQPELLPRADGPRRVSDLFLGLVEHPVETVPLPTAFEPPPAWERTWTGHTELDHSTPHPASFAPGLWREYVGWVLRADRLLADGYDEDAGKARDRAEQLRQQILAARPFPVSPQTLALPFALGQAPTVVEPAALTPLVARLAQASDADRPAEWEKAKREVGGDSAAVRLALGRALVEWVAADPPTRLPLAPPVVAVLTEGFTVRPAELHFLVMLARDLPPHPQSSAVWPLVQRVLRLRVQAEQVATGSDAGAVRLWVAESIRTADAARRPAEDLLFATDDASWKSATEFATTAERAYADAERVAIVVRAARTTWHTSIPNLSGLGEWLAAGEHPADLLGRMTREEVLATARAVWANVHRLAELCDSTPATDRVEALRRLTEAVAGRLDVLRVAHRDAVKRLLDARPDAERRADLVRWWHAADAALAVPFAERRRELLVEYRRASRQLHVTGDTRPEPLTVPTPEAVEERAFDFARRRGLLHLAALGGDGYRATVGDGFDRTVFQADQFSRRADAAAELVEVGDRFGTAARRLPSVAAAKAENDGTLPEAERLTRVSLIPVTADPASRLRRRQGEQLLLWHADRTTTDRWFGGDHAKPYYRHAADLIRDDARKLADRRAVPPTIPATPFPLSATAPERVVVTDELTPRVTFTVAAAATPDAGFVVYQTPGSHTTRFVRATGGSRPDPIVLPVPDRAAPLPTEPTVEVSDLRLRGYFRGDTAETRSEIARHPVPHTVAVRRPPGEGVSMAVRPTPGVQGRYGVGGGTLHFVLDCSGSMAKAADDPASRGRYAEACDRLEEMLNAVPVGVTVAMSVFGQQTPSAKSPEDAFETVRPSAVWSGAGDIGEVMKRVRSLVPWDKSAVVSSVIRARAILGEPTGGPRAVILISDCVDNRFAISQQNPKRVSIKDVLRAAFPDGSTLHVVAFPAADKADDAIRNEFRVVEQFKPAGLFLTPDRTDEPIRWVRTATAPRVRLTLTPESAGRPQDVAAGTAAADNWLTPLPQPGRYRLRFAGVEQLVEMTAGERLLVGLSQADSGLRFTRPNFAADVPAVSRKSSGAWTVAVPHQRLLESGGLALTLVADRTPEPTARMLTPTRIADAWFELTPTAARSPVAVRWAADAGWPTPAWALDTRSWPAAAGGKPSPPGVSAWWSADRPFTTVGTWAVPSDGSWVDAAPVRVPTTDGDVTVNSVSLEDHDGCRCLVVRLTCPDGRPVYVRPTGTPPVGSEVRVYRDANRTTCLFWWGDAGATRAAVRAATGFEVVSVTAAKRAAEADGTHVELPPLPAPAVGPPMPPPAPR